MATRSEIRLAEIANEMAEQVQKRLADIEAQLREIEVQKAELESELNHARLAHQRALNYMPRLGPDYQCPRCGIEHETRSAMRSIPGGKGFDILACEVCGIEIEVPNRW